MHGDAFDEHVRHVAEIEGDIDFQALAVELDMFRLAARTAGDVEEEPDVGVRAVAVHTELERLAGFVFGLVGNEFERAEVPRGRIVAAGAMDVETGRTLDCFTVLE